MPVIMHTDETNAEDANNVLRYPDESKVLTGVVYGRSNEYVGKLNPDDYVHEAPAN